MVIIGGTFVDCLLPTAAAFALLTDVISGRQKQANEQGALVGHFSVQLECPLPNDSHNLSQSICHHYQVHFYLFFQTPNLCFCYCDSSFVPIYKLSSQHTHGFSLRKDCRKVKHFRKFTCAGKKSK